jgi:hypothetical protein
MLCHPHCYCMTLLYVHCIMLLYHAKLSSLSPSLPATVSCYCILLLYPATATAGALLLPNTRGTRLGYRYESTVSSYIIIISYQPAVSVYIVLDTIRYRAIKATISCYTIVLQGATSVAFTPSNQYPSRYAPTAVTYLPNIYSYRISYRIVHKHPSMTQLYDATGCCYDAPVCSSCMWLLYGPTLCMLLYAARTPYGMLFQPPVVCCTSSLCYAVLCTYLPPTVCCYSH